MFTRAWRQVKVRNTADMLILLLRGSVCYWQKVMRFESNHYVDKTIRHHGGLM